MTSARTGCRDSCSTSRLKEEAHRWQAGGSSPSCCACSTPLGGSAGTPESHRGTFNYLATHREATRRGGLDDGFAAAPYVVADGDRGSPLDVGIQRPPSAGCLRRQPRRRPHSGLTLRGASSKERWHGTRQR